MKRTIGTVFVACAVTFSTVALANVPPPADAAPDADTPADASTTERDSGLPTTSRVDSGSSSEPPADVVKGSCSHGAAHTNSMPAGLLVVAGLLLLRSRRLFN